MPKGIQNKRYTGAFKQTVVGTMIRNKRSYKETARQFDISGHQRFADWERIYLLEGPEGLYIEHRGRGSKAPSKISQRSRGGSAKGSSTTVGGECVRT